MEQAEHTKRARLRTNSSCKTSSQPTTALSETEGQCELDNMQQDYAHALCVVHRYWHQCSMCHSPLPTTLLLDLERA